MKTFEINEKFGIDALTQQERPQPTPDYGQVLIRVNAVALNYRDLLVITGQYSRNLPMPLIPCSDGVGEVVSVGAGVNRVHVGDRVAGIFFQTWLGGTPTKEIGLSAMGGAINGMMADYVILHQDGVVHVPEHLTDAEAATLPCAGVTAWNALIESGLHPGETVLILGTGGVSLFALQFAKQAGARVIVTSSQDEKLEHARQMGADVGINYRTHPEWAKQVLAATDGTGVDYVVEVGGAGTLPQSLKAVRVGGTLSLIGVLTGNRGEVNPVPLLMKSVTLRGIYVGSRAMFERMNRAIAQTQIHPVIDRVFAFQDFPDALRYMESGHHVGKICIQL